MGKESEELFVLKREDLIAPKNYNLVNEIEKFSRSKEKNALIWEDQTGGGSDFIRFFHQFFIRPDFLAACLIFPYKRVLLFGRECLKRMPFI
jgi:hypothetical protein